MAEGDDEAAERTDSDGSENVTEETTADGSAETGSTPESAGDSSTDSTADESDQATDGDRGQDGTLDGETDSDRDSDEGTDDVSASMSESDTTEKGDSDESAETIEGSDGDAEGGQGVSQVAGQQDGTPTEANNTTADGGQQTPTTGGGFEGAPDDEEMPLTVHIEEMLKRLAAVIVVMGGVSLIVFPVAPDLINWLWYSYLPGSPEACASGTAESTACPRVYHPLGLLFARIKVASLVGFVLALPVFVYQTYLFMRPGLYPHERRYYLAAVPTSLLLAFVGLAFSYFLVLPFIFTYFLFYSEDVAQIAFGLTETFDLILLMMGMFAAIFQIPLFIMLAIMMGVTTRDWLEEKRYYFWLGFAGFAFIFSPDPTGMAPFMVGITMVALYELTLLLLRWTGR
jgi:sec-independent protein translocase protein TatC